ncbi:MAG: thiamine pyrophosphate-dependent enzyme [Rickettsiales bacterium]|nr:thiamine pyrophosphate-dependent enzyme [Rickettsiales bacterium]
MQDRATIVHENFLKRVAEEDLPTPLSTSLEVAGISAVQLRQIVESQFLSRHLDNTSRKLKDRGESFYTIGSSGHEGNAAIASAFRIDDMAFLHYRGAAFFIERAKKAPSIDIAQDMLLSFAASKDDPISGGRHKVLGSKRLFVPPQTSTIASHLPKAVGTASSIGVNRRLKQAAALPRDSIVMCSFGDASLNHSTSQGAINTASWTAYKKIHTPILFICEDNGIGISTETPDGWVQASMSNKPAIKYFTCNGLDALDTYRTARQAETYIRKTRMPAFLHMRCIRLFGHAGADAQHVYMSMDTIVETEAHDPLLYSARLLIDHCNMSSTQVLELYQTIQAEVETKAEFAITRPKLETSKEVMASIIPPKLDLPPPTKPTKAERTELFKADKSRISRPQNMARMINWTLADLMLEQSNIVLAGEDIGKKGGVYSVTSRLHDQFGAHRVIDTLLDEQSILGLAIGMAHNGILPIPEIQFLAYLHNAEDQLRGEAATLPFFSEGQYTNPMVIRIAGLAYQKGFGGHFHNDNSFAVLRDIPGVIIACPSNGADAVGMLRECVRLAREEQRIVIFLEPIALYMTRDLHEPKDEGWSFTYEDVYKQDDLSLGQLGQHGNGKELAILTYGNGYYLSRQAEKTLTEKHGIKSRIIDLRWLAPLDETAILEAVKSCEHILIVDECRVTGSLSEQLMALLMEKLSPLPALGRIAADDSFIPLGKAATATLPSAKSIVEAALELTDKSKKTCAA